ncbi:hypothetical protein QJS10_CPB15g00915 [Acorus calamus]|uniref:Uncharacterized protein n=1 Tax=Acorus calamus TaxID=4465 RepID=A0AAV9D8F2_ACOCL|nr:hypothetical protein QJS10_CPB15g00915 [Acorus calamus]
MSESLKRLNHKAESKQRDARAGVNQGYIARCTTALMACNIKNIMLVWFYEHTRLRSPSAYRIVPRFFQWGRMNDKSLLFRCSGQFHLLRAEQPTQATACQRWDVWQDMIGAATRK